MKRVFYIKILNTYNFVTNENYFFSGTKHQQIRRPFINKMQLQVLDIIKMKLSGHYEFLEAIFYSSFIFKYFPLKGLNKW